MDGSKLPMILHLTMMKSGEIDCAVPREVNLKRFWCI